MSRNRRFSEPGGRDQEIVILPSRGKLTLVLVGVLALVAVGVFLVFGDVDDAIPGVAISGVVGTVFFGACSAILVWQLVAPRPVLVLDRHGIIVGALASGGNRIPWSEIGGSRVFTFRWQRMVGIDLIDPEGYLARLSPVKRRLARVNLKLGFPLIAVPSGILPLSCAELVEEIDGFRLRGVGGDATA